MDTRQLRRAALKVVSENPQAAKPFELTELGNAERLVAQHGRSIRYCYAFKSWFVYDNTRWKQDDTGEIVRLAKHTVRKIYEEAAAEEDTKRRQAVADWARRSERAASITSMIRLAESEPGVPIRPDELDADAFLLNTLNGTIDLKNGELRPHRREDQISKLAPVRFDPSARSERWERFIAEIFAPHPDLAGFVQRALGYGLTADTREECLFLLFGAGRNGKGTLLSTLAAVLGDYAGTADFSTFVSTRDDRGPRDDVANMAGKRLIAAQESREGAALAESLIKHLTGGDRVRARRLFENSWEFQPSHKILLATNYKPVIRGVDEGIWSRIRLVPFDVNFSGREDRMLKPTLLAELPGILNWCVEGCLRWQRDGLHPSATVTDATAAYRSECDQLGRFIQECCVTGDGFRAKARNLYTAYRRWADGSGEEPVTETAFGRRMAERGVTRTHTKQGAIYQDIGLRASDGGDES